MSISKPTEEQIKNSQDFEAAQCEQCIQQNWKKIQGDQQISLDKANEKGASMVKEIEKTIEDIKKDVEEFENEMDINAAWSALKSNEGTALLNSFNTLSSNFATALGPAGDALGNIGSDWMQIWSGEDSKIMQKMASQLLTVIASTFEVLLSPISTFESVVPDIPLAKPVKTIIKIIKSFVELCAKNIPDEELDKILNSKLYADARAKAEQDAMKNGGILGASVDYFNENINPFVGWEDCSTSPELPGNWSKILEDLKDIIKQVLSNLPNLIIIVILKLIGAIFDCLNEICGILGVPAIPDPLNKIMKMIPDAIQIFTFVMAMPASLMRLLYAVLKNKWKQIQIMSTPVPPLPEAPLDGTLPSCPHKSDDHSDSEKSSEENDTETNTESKPDENIVIEEANNQSEELKQDIPINENSKEQQTESGPTFNIEQK